MNEYEIAKLQHGIRAKVVKQEINSANVTVKNSKIDCKIKTKH